jgi:hypothetical protein
LENEKIFIGFDMSKKQIDKYYKTIDAHIDKVNYNKYITGDDADKLTSDDIKKIENNWNSTNNFHLGNLYIRKTRGRNYGYNDPDTNYMKYWDGFINPLQTKIGYIIIEKDIDIYNSKTKEKIAPGP